MNLFYLNESRLSHFFGAHLESDQTLKSDSLELKIKLKLQHFFQHYLIDSFK
jgi:hypothetical protein